MKRMIVTLLLVGGAATGCTKQNHGPAAGATAPVSDNATRAPQQDLDPARVVATLDGQPITVKDVDAEISPQLSQLNQQFESEKFGLRKQAIDEVLVRRLIDAEAKKEGTTEDGWLKKHLEASAPDASEADAKKFYDENSGRMDGHSFDEQKPHIVAFLTGQKRHEAAAKLFEDLKSKAKIQITLVEPVASAAADTSQSDLSP